MGENFVCLQLDADDRWVVMASGRPPVLLAWCGSAEHALQHAQTMFPQSLVVVTSMRCRKLFARRKGHLAVNV